MTARQYLRAGARFWWLVLPCVVIGIPVAALLVSTSPSTYTSSASVLVSPTPASGATSSDKYVTNQLAQQRMFTYEGLAAGPELVDAVRGEFTGLSPAEVRRDLVVTVPDNSTVLNIDARASSRGRAQELASVASDSLTQMINKLESTNGAQKAVLRARVTTRAGATTTATPPPTWRNAALGGVAGLVVGLALAVAAWRFDPRLHDDESVTAVLEAPVLGRLPMEARNAPRLASASRKPWGDAVRELRTILFFRHPRGDGCLTVAITSPRRIDDTSKIGADLATALTETGARVLLVEADLDASGASPLIDQPVGESGLVSYLVGESSEEGVIWRDETSGVDVIPAGSTADQAGELLHARAFATLLADVAQRYDFVLVTAPATSQGTDALAVAARCDGTVLMVPAKTRREQLRAARVLLERVDARILGSVRLT